MRGFPQEDTLSAVKRAGWAVKKHIDSEVRAVKITQKEWCIVSCEEKHSQVSKVFTDEKIEAGLSEFDKTQMSGIVLDETIDHRGVFLCVKLTVPQ